MLFSGDWIWSAFAAALLAGLIVAATNVLLWWMARRRRYMNVSRLQMIEGTWALLVICLLNVYFRIDEEQLFERVFSVPPPPGLRNLDVERHYQGGPGDTAILIRFEADRATLDKLMSQPSFQSAQEQLDEHRKLYPDPLERWRWVFQASLTFASDSWQTPPPISAPRLYRWDSLHLSAEMIVVLWDADSGKAYVAYSLG